MTSQKPRNLTYRCNWIHTFGSTVLTDGITRVHILDQVTTLLLSDRQDGTHPSDIIKAWAQDKDL